MHKRTCRWGWRLRFGAMTAALAALPLVGAGCSGTKVWVERTENFSVPAAALDNLMVETHNGGVTVRGEAERSDIDVTARIRGGGATRKSAHASLDAIELVSESAAANGHRLSWRWTQPRRQDWGAQVSFDIDAPAKIALNVETHNGGVGVDGLAGCCDLKTHNGGVKATHIAGPLRVETHNGGIHASVSGSEVELRTHNGGVHLDASACGPLGGEVVSYNGGLRIDVGGKTSAELSCTTHNGGLNCSADLADLHASRTRLTGRLGDGGPALVALTHNGGVRIRQID